MSTWAYQPKHEYMSIQPKHEYNTSPNMSTWAYQPKHEYMSIPAQTWVHEHTSPNMSTWDCSPNSKDVSILYEITGDWWQRYYMILHRIQLYWLHEHTSTNMGTYIQAYQHTKHEYMSIPAQTWVHEHTSQTWTWDCREQHIEKSQEIGGKDITWYYTEYNYTDYMSIPAQTWVHEIVGNSKDVSILYEITGDWWQRYYMILHRIQLYWLHGYTMHKWQ